MKWNADLGLSSARANRCRVMANVCSSSTQSSLATFWFDASTNNYKFTRKHAEIINLLLFMQHYNNSTIIILANCVYQSPAGIVLKQLTE